jgi:hypothetical protein
VVLQITRGVRQGRRSDLAKVLERILDKRTKSDGGDSAKRAKAHSNNIICTKVFEVTVGNLEGMPDGETLLYSILIMSPTLPLFFRVFD